MYYKCNLFINFSDTEIKPKYTNNPDICIHPKFLELYKNLNIAKNKISFNLQKWETYHKYSKRKNNRISRGYYKLQNIFDNFELFNDKNIKIKSFHLCEAPGAFLEFTLDNFNNVEWNSMSLIEPSDKNIPVMHNKFNKKNILDGGVFGDICNINNSIYFDKKLHFKYNLITCDGGVSVSTMYNIQEHITQKLIYAQLLSTLYLQQKGGVFILKIFDTLTKFSINILHIICNYWENVYIFKPENSRPGNSEKYIICKNFKGIQYDMLDIFYKCFEDITSNFDTNNFIEQLFECNYSNSIEKISNINKAFVNNQIIYISSILK